MKPTEEKIQSNTSDLPVYLFKQGNNCEAYRYFGAHLETRAGSPALCSAYGHRTPWPSAW